MKEIDSVYQIGFNAYTNGYGREDHPLYFNSAQIKEWLRGWNAACYEVGEIQ